MTIRNRLSNFGGMVQNLWSNLGRICWIQLVQLVLCVGGRALDTWTHLVTWTQGHTDRQDTANMPQITGSNANVGLAASSTLQLLVVQDYGVDPGDNRPSTG